MNEFSSSKFPSIKISQLLLIIALLGTIAFLLYPPYQMAVNRASQKSTLKDMFDWSRALSSFLADHEYLPAMAGKLTFKREILKLFAPYLTYIRLNDYWGNRYFIWTGKNCHQYGIVPAENDYLIASFGKDRIKENWKYDPGQKVIGLYLVKDISDFNKDLIIYNAILIRGPR